MKRTRWRRSLAMRSLLFAILATAIPEADLVLAQADHRQVLVLHSTRRDAQVTTIADLELPRALDAGLNGEIDFHSEYIDAARFPEDAYRTAFADFLGVKYQRRRFDLVIGLGDDAVNLINSHRPELFHDTPLVFLSNTRATQAGPNATGLILERNFVATLPLIEKLQPDVTQVFVVTGAAATDRVFEDMVREQFRRYESRLTFTYLSGLATADLERRLAALPPRSAVFYALVSQDGAGYRFHPLRYLERVVAAATAPTYSWVDSTLGRGIVGGSLYSQQAATNRVAQLALRVLRGERADTIPVSRLDLNSDQVDSRQLRRWGISQSRVPSGALRFHEPGLWGRYKAYVLAATAIVLLQTVLITGLLIQRERRQRAERALHRRQSDLQVSYGRIRDLASRLFLAQETERARLAHELHDDISQQLSLLAIHLAMLRGTAPASSTDLIDEASARTESIVASVHDLSRRLHPHKLRLLGLVAALQDLRNEVAQAGISITFTHAHVPAKLPQDLTLCLFRIVQEALQNVVKHSQAGKVTMHLTGGPADLVLTIADDGVGFDVDTAWGDGLGLVGIRERLDAIGGTVDIRSQPGHGTRLEIRVARFVIEDTQPSSTVDSFEITPPLAR